MSKVIKARATRLLPPGERPQSPKKVEGDTSESGAAAEDWRESDAYQAAYDEVVEAAQAEVALLIEDARRRARDITDEAARQAETAREEARREGFAAGRTEGYDAGFAQAGRDLEDLLTAAQTEAETALSTAHSAYDNMLRDIEPKIYRLALDIAEKILGYELDNNKDAFLAMVAAALDVMKSQSRVTLHVNTQEFTAAFHSRDEARVKTGKGSIDADIALDPAVAPYGCLIETDNGTVDGSVSAQLEQVAMNMGLGSR